MFHSYNCASTLIDLHELYILLPGKLTTYEPEYGNLYCQLVLFCYVLGSKILGEILELNYT